MSPTIESVTDLLLDGESESISHELIWTVVSITSRTVPIDTLQRLAVRCRNAPEPFYAFLDLVEAFLEGREATAG